MAEKRLFNIGNWQRYLLALAGFIVTAIILFFVTDRFLMPFIIQYNETVHVPKVMGLPREEAIQAMESRGLNVQNIHEQYDARYPGGRVINQLPYPGAEVKKGRRVYLTVSKGKETITMPVLTGLTLRDARISLLQKGLQVAGVSYESNEEIPRNVIMAQSIPPNTAVTYGAAVQIIISSGPMANIPVPTLTNYTIEDARNILEQLSLRIGTISYVSDETFASGTIIEQDPPPGALVQNGMEVNIKVIQ